MNKCRLLLFFIALLLTFINAKGQSRFDVAPDLPFSKLSAIGVPSPTAASLGTYAQYPVGSFTGVPEISIPLYEINEGGFKLPISLSYNASGIKVNDVASWVGLGWSLNAGGVITRNVKGVPDDQLAPTDPTPPAFGHGIGFLFRNYNKSVTDINNIYAPLNFSYWLSQDPTTYTNPGPTIPDEVLPDASGFNRGSQYMPTDLYYLRRAGVDLEPDIFYFNFNGHVGKFLFSQGTDPVTNIGVVAPDQHQILQIPQQDIKMSYQMNLAYNANDINGDRLTSFTVVDENGNKYLFDQREQTWLNQFILAANNAGTFAGEPANGYFDSFFTSSWYLSTITTALGRVIHFNYTEEDSYIALPDTYEKGGFNGVVNNPLTTSTTSSNHIDGVRLSSIEGDDFKVYLDANENRQDLAGTNALTAIRIFSKDQTGNQTFIKEFDFSYSYLQSLNPPAGNDVTNGDIYKRLMLTSVQEKTTENIVVDGGSTVPTTKTKPPYQFFYSGFSSNDAVSPLPNRRSSQQDFWGYFNSNTSSAGIYSLVPTVYVYPNYARQDHLSVLPLSSPDPNDPVFTIPGADRTADITKVMSGTLNKIQYPTGGYTSFQFESNQFNYEGQNYYGGGLRLQKSIAYDGINTANNIVKQYTYFQSANPSNSSGVLFNLPSYAYCENFINYWDSTNTDPNGRTTDYDPNTIDYYNHNLVVGNVPMFTMSGFDGVNVGYSEITESNNGNGSSLSKYTTPGQYGDMSDADNLFEAPTVQIYDQHIDCLVPALDNTQLSDLRGVTSDPWGFPFAPSLNYDWNRGKLLSESTFNQNGAIVSEKDYNYTLYTPLNTGPRYVLGLVDRLASNYHLWLTQCTEPFFQYFYIDHISQYPIITNIAKVISSETTKSYDSTNPALISTSTTSYTYSPNCMNPSLVETTDSKGNLEDTYMTYPSDYTQLDANASDSHAVALYNLQQNNVINPVIEQYTLKKNSDGSNSRVIGANLQTFKANQPLPDAGYRIENIGALASFSPATITNSGIVKDPNYNPTPFVSFDSYDGNGNLLQQHKLSSPALSYQWGYNGIYPVAQVTNAPANDIYYDSFEEGDGNSSINDAKTGHYSYIGSYSKTLSGLNPGSYILSYWLKSSSGNIWSQQMSTVLAGSSYTITLSGQIDDVRFYPVNAQMETFTYDPLIGMNSMTDSKEQCTYYEYDEFQRLKFIKDKDKNIIKAYCYNYLGQQTDCFTGITTIVQGSVYARVEYSNYNYTSSYTDQDNYSDQTTADINIVFYSDPSCQTHISISTALNIVDNEGYSVTYGYGGGNSGSNPVTYAVSVGSDHYTIGTALVVSYDNTYTDPRSGYGNITDTGSYTWDLTGNNNSYIPEPSLQ